MTPCCVSELSFGYFALKNPPFNTNGGSLVIEMPRSLYKWELGRLKKKAGQAHKLPFFLGKLQWLSQSCLS